jgi:L-ascorbate metabolism protein UlaG (beta-lactamase superfamily)
MFQLTALGHHCWLVEGQGTRLLVDPILTEGWGFSPVVGLRVWPPRVLDPAAWLMVGHLDHLGITRREGDRRLPGPKAGHG